MRTPHDHRPRARGRGRAARASRARRAVAAVGCLTFALSAAVALAAPSGTVNFSDEAGDARTSLDLRRASLKLDRGRLLASISLGADWDASDLVTENGPPGSICLRVWTSGDDDPANMPPDYLVCLTTRRDGRTMEAGIFRERSNRLPERRGSAEVSRPSERSVHIRVSQSSLGDPERIQAAFETTRPGCPRVSCVDRMPEGAKVRVFRMR